MPDEGGSKVENNNRSSTIMVKGKPKSGRIWKEQHARSSAIVNVKPLRSSWRTKMNKKLAKRSIKSFENELRDSENKAKKEKRLIMEARKKIKEENAKKAEIVQVINKSSTLKKMKKKHLKSIEMR